MGDRVILPGYGGAYTTVEVGSTDAIIAEKGADLTLDLSYCDSFAIQVLSTQATPTGSVQVMQTFNNASYQNLGNTISIATDAIQMYTVGSGPFGKIKIDATAITAGSVKLVITGFNKVLH